MRKGTTHSEATRLKMRLAKLGKPSNRKGVPMSEESKEKLRQTITPIVRRLAKSKAWRKKVSEGTKLAYKRIDVQENCRLRNGGHSNNWQGGVTYKQNGYKLIHKPSHPNRDKRGYIMEHRFVMSEHLGRPLTKDEVVHHIDHDITNNDISNLQLFESKSAHRKHHANH